MHTETIELRRIARRLGPRRLRRLLLLGRFRGRLLLRRLWGDLDWLLLWLLNGHRELLYEKYVLKIETI